MRQLAYKILLFCMIINSSPLLSQPKDTAVGRPYQKIASQLITTGLGSGRAYEILYELTTKIGARLSGSPEAAQAVAWAKHKMEEFGFQNVHLEPVMVPHWVRGPLEEASIIHATSGSNIPLTICALGGSVATPEDGITAEVLEVKSFKELRAKAEQAKGKIIFFNRPMDRTKIHPFAAYGGAVNQRGWGAVEAAKVGGAAVLVRSMTTRFDDVPHTGAMHYNDTIPKIPAAAISTMDSEFLDSLLSTNKNFVVNLKLTCQTLPDVESANVVGELKGSELPSEVVLIGGHLDSWDKGQGAHDDGAGCAQSIEAIRLLKSLGLHPKRTIRAVLFMNEEHGLSGGRAYAAKDRPGESHIAAIESDAGGFSPRGFGVRADSLTYEKIARWSYLLEPIGADHIHRGGGGADISVLGKSGVATIGLNVDSQRYFDYHHSDNDTFDKVNERELELGAIAIAILTYVLAEEGI